MSRAPLRHTLYKRLFIPASDIATIRCDAITRLNADGAACVANAYIEATLSYLDSKGLVSIEHLDVDSGARLAHVASALKR